MGIGRRVREPLRVVSVTCDSAIDQTKTPMLEYIESREPGLVVAMPGESVDWFTLEVLSGDRADAIRSLSSPIRERVAFQSSCSGCSNPDLLPADAWDGSGDTRKIRQRYMDQLPDKLPRELGAVALKLGELSVGESPRFGLPGGSLATPKRPRDTTAPSANDSAPSPRER